MSLPQRFKLVFFVPTTALQGCKTAVFAAGAGKFPGPGGYTECAFTSKGMGQFRPGDAANPHVSFYPSFDPTSLFALLSSCLVATFGGGAEGFRTSTYMLTCV